MKSLLLFICLLLNFLAVSSSFQTSFFREINEEKKNILISPLSAYQVLGLTANGAKNKTLDEMLLALGNPSLEELNKINKKILDISKDFSTIEIANAIMTNLRPDQGFLDAAKLYEATIEPLKSAAQVNNWCNLKTHGKIPGIIKELDPLTVMLLLNAIYFKGVWKTEFDEKNTKKDIFYNFNDKSKATLVDKMTIEEYFNYYEDDEVQVVELPYTHDSMSAIIMLPKIDINAFISNLSDEKLQHLTKRLNKQIVDLELPKFKIEFDSSLKNVLIKMGMNLPFEGGADFTGISRMNLYISDVIQKTFLSVDEKGTEAAAVTVVIVNTRGVGIENKSMVIDKPFLFMLRNTNLPLNYDMLFMAKIEEL